MARLTAATNAADLELARTMWREYARVVDDPAWFPGFDAELAELASMYGPPGGTFLLAWEGDELAACGALRRIDEDAGEVRRVYVRPKFRGRGLARSISMALMGEARRIGYASVKLDVPPKLAEGVKLYQSLGFTQIPAYAGQPAGAVCMEARVRSGPRRT
jgi:GNAT superfamily N-acetyltransferase